MGRAAAANNSACLQRPPPPPSPSSAFPLPASGFAQEGLFLPHKAERWEPPYRQYEHNPLYNATYAWARSATGTPLGRCAPRPAPLTRSPDLPQNILCHVHGGL